MPLVTLSAAITAFLEAHYPDDATKNQLARAGPLTDTPETFPYAFMMNMMNRGTWSQTPEIAAWLAQSRLDPTAPTIARMMAAGDPRLAVLAGFPGGGDGRDAGGDPAWHGGQGHSRNAPPK